MSESRLQALDQEQLRCFCDFVPISLSPAAMSSMASQPSDSKRARKGNISLLQEAVQRLTAEGADVQLALSLETAAREGPAKVGDEVLLTPVPVENHVPVLVNVPPDGLCFFHCIIAAHNLPAWVAEHKEDGWGKTAEIQKRDTAQAMAFRNKMIDELKKHGPLRSFVFVVTFQHVSKPIC